MSITSQGQVGIGTAYPNARQEISYCPPSGQKENGLVVSLFNCNSGSYGYTDPNGGGLEGPGDGGGALSVSMGSFVTNLYDKEETRQSTLFPIWLSVGYGYSL